jgi:hypothetical protein
MVVARVHVHAFAHQPADPLHIACVGRLAQLFFFLRRGRRQTRRLVADVATQLLPQFGQNLLAKGTPDHILEMAGQKVGVRADAGVVCGRRAPVTAHDDVRRGQLKVLEVTAVDFFPVTWHRKVLLDRPF